MKITDEMLAKVPALKIGQWSLSDDKTDGWQILVRLDGSLQVHKLDRERGTAAIFGFEGGMQAYIRAVLEAALSAAPPVEYAGLVRKLKAGEAGLFEVESIEDLMADAADAITALEARVALAEGRISEMTAALSDPSAVHLNMLAGQIAKPTAAQILHLYGDQLIRPAVLAEREACAVIAEARDLAFMSSTAADVRAREIAAAIRARTQADAPAQPVATAERALADKILAELAHARTKFPGRNVTFAALVEEVGELATATFEEARERVEKEAVQVAVMAMRMVLDGDHTFDAWRASKGLDPLTDCAPAQPVEVAKTTEAPSVATNLEKIRDADFYAQRYLAQKQQERGWK